MPANGVPRHIMANLEPPYTTSHSTQRNGSTTRLRVAATTKTTTQRRHSGEQSRKGASFARGYNTVVVLCLCTASMALGVMIGVKFLNFFTGQPDVHSKGSTRLTEHFAMVTDLDHHSLKVTKRHNLTFLPHVDNEQGKDQWHAFLRRGTVVRDEATGLYNIDWGERMSLETRMSRYDR